MGLHLHSICGRFVVHAGSYHAWPVFKNGVFRGAQAAVKRSLETTELELARLKPKRDVVSKKDAITGLYFGELYDVLSRNKEELKKALPMLVMWQDETSVPGNPFAAMRRGIPPQLPQWGLRGNLAGAYWIATCGSHFSPGQVADVSAFLSDPELEKAAVHYWSVDKHMGEDAAGWFERIGEFFSDCHKAGSAVEMG